MKQDYSFGRAEKLKSKKIIARMFSEGDSVGAFPLRLVYLPLDAGEVPIQFGVSVSKKKFRHATDRNRIKRQIREAYRLQKPPLLADLAAGERRFAWMVIYTGKEIPAYEQLERSMKKLLRKFRKQIAL